MPNVAFGNDGDNIDMSDEGEYLITVWHAAGAFVTFSEGDGTFISIINSTVGSEKVRTTVSVLKQAGINAIFYARRTDTSQSVSGSTSATDLLKIGVSAGTLIITVVKVW